MRLTVSVVAMRDRSLPAAVRASRSCACTYSGVPNGTPTTTKPATVGSVVVSAQRSVNRGSGAPGGVMGALKSVRRFCGSSPPRCSRKHLRRLTVRPMALSFWFSSVKSSWIFSVGAQNVMSSAIATTNAA